MKFKEKKRELIYDILPLRKKVPYWMRAFYLLLRTSKIAGLAVFLGIIIFGGIMVWALTSGITTGTLRLYSSVCEGGPAISGTSWQNPQNVQGPPEVRPSGDINSFSEANSAVYKSGQASLICQDFVEAEQTLTATSTLDSAELKSARVVFSLGMGEKGADIYILPVEEFAASTDDKVLDSYATSTEDVEADEVVFDLDTRIIIWYSLNGELWWQLDTISDYPLSNLLNGGYFSYDAPFLETWEDVRNLKIKFEGVVGVETEVLTFLDSVWLEVDYIEADETPMSTPVPEHPEGEQAPYATSTEIFLTGQATSTEISLTEQATSTPPQEGIWQAGAEIEFLSAKKDFELNDGPTFKFRYQKKRGSVESIGANVSNPFHAAVLGLKNINIKATVLGLNINPNIHHQENGEFLVELEKSRAFRPGKYKLKIEIEDNGEIYSQEQDFTWGVLAINFNKSIYLSSDSASVATSAKGAALAKEGLPNDPAYIQMGVLDDKGHTICDANLVFSIKYLVSGMETILSTEDGTIQYSGKCGPNNITDVPDYFAYYQVDGAGVYQMKLTNLDNGYEITDSFEVRESAPFDVERIGPTRIYPPVSYQMKMRIKANQDFKGLIIESVPDSFEVLSPEFGQIRTQIDTKEIVWQVDWKQGETHELIYRFDAPDISPYLYLVGPLEFHQ